MSEVIKNKTLMWFGKYKGYRFEDIPLNYLEYLTKLDNCEDRIKVYYKKVLKSIKIKFK